MVPAPIERSELRGHRQQIGKSAALSVGRSPALSALRPLRLERSAEFGSVNRSLPSRARARRRRFQRALTPTDLHRPAGRRCGCWPTSTVLFRGIVVRQIRRRTLALGRSAPMLTSASPDRGGGDGAGADRAQRATGSSPTIGKSAAPTVGRSPASLSAAALRSNDQRNLAR